MREMTVMHNIPAACLIGLVALIAAGGCGAETAPSFVPPDVPIPDSPSAFEPGSAPPATAIESQEEASRRLPGYRRDFDVPLRAPAVATGDPELDPLVSYLKASFAGPIQDGRRLVIKSLTDAHLRYDERGFDLPGERYQKKLDGLLWQASGRVPAEMIRDFGEKNRGRHAIWPDLTGLLPAVLLTPEESKAIFSGFPDEGWKSFYAKYPDAYGIISVSRVGLNHDRTLAYFYVDVGQGSLNAHGQYHVLKKEGAEWVELPINIGGFWTA